MNVCIFIVCNLQYRFYIQVLYYNNTGHYDIETHMTTDILHIRYKQNIEIYRIQVIYYSNTGQYDIETHMTTDSTY